MLNGIVISVVIPIYNAAGSLGRCLDCLLAQTHEALEIICVNDGSTDASADILEDHAKKDSRIRVITQRNSGAGAARNAGFEAATGKYVIFLDSDDIFEPDMLYSMAERLETTGADAAVCLYDAFDSSTGEPVINCWMPPEELMQLSVFSPTERNDCLYQLVQGWPWDKMFRAEHIRKHNITYPHLPNSQDMVFVFEALALAERVSVVGKTLVHRMMNRAGSISNSRTAAVGSVYDACVMLLERLESDGVLERYKSSAYRFILDLLLWHLRTLSGDAQRQCYELLRGEWSQGLRLDCMPPEVYAPHDYKEYQRILRCSFRRYTMSKKFRNFFKRILPPPTNTFNREIDRVRSEVAALRREVAENSYDENAALCRRNAEDIAALAESNRRLTELVEQQHRQIELLAQKLDSMS